MGPGLCGGLRVTETERVVLRGRRMVDLLPRMRGLDAAGWRLVRMTKPVAEGLGEIEAVFERGEAEG